jgi:hypothetical protein
MSMAPPDHPWHMLCALCRFAGKPTPDDAIFATATLAGSKPMYAGWDEDLHYMVSLDLFK